IEAQIERLAADQQRVLEVAAIAGTSFNARTCGPLVGMTPEQFAEHCEPLARRQHIIRAGSSREFEFVHVLYREVLSRRQTPGLRSSRHRQLGEAIGTLCDPREGAAGRVENFAAGLDWARKV